MRRLLAILPGAMKAAPAALLALSVGVGGSVLAQGGSPGPAAGGSVAATSVAATSALSATSPPSPTPEQGTAPDRDRADVITTGDPRSEGAGPGLVGNPLLVLLGVVLIGVITAGLTAMLVRLSGRGQP